MSACRQPQLGCCDDSCELSDIMATPVLRKILVVEDEPDIQDVVRLSLEAVGGFEVEMCGSSLDALQCILDYMPDLVLLDVMMPHMDGTQILQALHSNPKIAHIPVIFLTGRVHPTEINAYRAMGALAVICKPFDSIRLPVDIEEAWARFQKQGRRNRPPFDPPSTAFLTAL